MRALRNGIDVAQILEVVVAKARRKTDVPIILFSYLNPLLQFGTEASERRSATRRRRWRFSYRFGARRSEDFAADLAANDLDHIFLVAPTSTDERLAIIAAQATGFIYAVSRTGVTGAQTELSNEAEKLVARVRRVTDLPIAVGFGISTREQVMEVWRYADAAVVGSAIVAEIERQQHSGSGSR